MLVLHPNTELSIEDKKMFRTLQLDGQSKDFQRGHSQRAGNHGLEDCYLWMMARVLNRGVLSEER